MDVVYIENMINETIKSGYEITTEIVRGISLILFMIFIAIAFWLSKHFSSKTIELRGRDKHIIIYSVLILFFSLLQGVNSLPFAMAFIPLLVKTESLSGLRIGIERKNKYKNIVIVGDGLSGRSIAENATRNKRSKYKIVGIINHINAFKRGGAGYNNLMESIDEMIRGKKVDEIVISIDDISYNELISIMDVCNQFKVKVKVSSPLFSIIAEKMRVKKYEGVEVINTTQGADIKYTLIAKRIIDMMGATIGLIVLLPVFIILASIIKITSRGPIFYKQVRIGKNGKPFNFYKFRSMTMVKGEDEERKKMMLEFMRHNGEGGTKIINDSRVTGIGKIIRKTSVDELPQLFNVLKGDMSLVGPRPCLQYEYDNYEEWQKKRTAIIPGCTGLWQVSGRSRVSFNDSILLDLFYINNISLLLDLKLILKTIPVMFFSKGGK